MANLPTGTVTFLFTDIESSTRLWEQYPDAMQQAMAQHDGIIEAAVSRYDGTLVRPRGEGDSRFAVFPRATQAVAAARDIQQTFAVTSWPIPAPLRARIALHTGEAEVREGDYYGSDVNRCARLRALASGGQTLLSQSTYALVQNALPERVRVRDLGEHRLKDLQRGEHVFQLVSPGVPADFPPLQSLDALPNNLPVQLTSFIGREREIAEIKRLFQTTRLMTLTGVGGTGKTRLALQSAAELLENFPDGVWFIELASHADPAHVPSRIAEVWNLRDESGRSPIETLTDYLRARTILLVLDNCEHLIEAAARTADILLRACPKLKVMATSREALGIAGELSWPVPSLTLPDSNPLASRAELAGIESIRLFVERAMFVLPTFSLTDENAPFITQICRRLDGIPLAIELAAARVKGMSVEEIANHLDDRFRLLTGGSRTAMARQQTLRSAIDWSHQLLSPDERALFRRLSVFAGGWTLHAAEEICAGMDGSTLDVMELMLRLVDKSLVIVDEDNGETRYRFLETIRQYAREKLAETEEARALRQRHCDWFLQFSERVEQAGQGRGTGNWLNRLDVEHDNLRTALSWTIEERHADRALRFGNALWRYWDQRGYFSEGLQWMNQILELAQAGDPILTPGRARLLIGASILFSRPDEHLKSKALSQEALALARQISDPLIAVQALRWLGATDLKLGHVADAVQEGEESLRLARALGDPNEIAQCLLTLAETNAVITLLSQAQALGEEALARIRMLENPLSEAEALATLGEIEYLQGAYPKAYEHLNSSLDLAQSAGNKHTKQIALRWLAHVARAQGEYTQAAALAQAELTWVRERGDRLCTSYLLYILGWTAYSRGDFKQAEDLCLQSVRLCEQVGSPPRIALVQTRLGDIYLAQGDLPRAAACLQAGLNWSHINQARGIMVESIEGCAWLALARGKPEAASRLLAAAESARQSLRLPIAPADLPAYTSRVDMLKTQLEEHSFEQTRAEGRGMTLQQASDLALIDE